MSQSAAVKLQQESISKKIGCARLLRSLRLPSVARVKSGMTIYAGVLFCLWVTVILIGGCSSLGKSSQQNLLKEYRKKFEMKKAALAKEEGKQNAAPEMGPGEYERLGDLYLKQGNMDLAFLRYDKALRMDPSRTNIHYKLGRLFLEKEILDEAGREFQETLKASPHDALAHEGMGRVYFKQSNFAEAETSFRRAIDLKNDSWQSHNFLGIIFDRRGEFELAINHFRSAIALKPNSSVLYNNLGISLCLKGDYEEAVRTFTEALTLENSNKRAHHNLALALSKLEREEENSGVFKKDGNEISAQRLNGPERRVEQSAGSKVEPSL